MGIENRLFCSFFILASGKQNDIEQESEAAEKRRKYVFNKLNNAYLKAEKSFLNMLSKYGQLKSNKISFEDYFELDNKDIAQEISLLGKYHIWRSSMRVRHHWVSVLLNAIKRYIRFTRN